MRTPISFTLGLAAGAAAVHFLGGRDRRNAIRDQAMSKASTAASAVQSQASHVANQAKGAAQTVTPSGTRLEQPDDVTLARKVETEIFRAADAPKGSVSAVVQAGIATLRGDAGEEGLPRLGEAGGHVPGIQGVQNLLHTPDAPTPAAEPGGLRPERFAS